MKNKSFILFASALLFSIFSCTAPAAEDSPALDLDKIKTEIQAMEDAYATASNAKDAEAIMAYYADDAVNMPNEQSSVTGKAAILERLKADMAKDTVGSSIVFEVVDLTAAGDYIIEAGKSTTTDANGKVTTGKYVSIFEKRNGKYECIRDIWNNDAPSEKK